MTEAVISRHDHDEFVENPSSKDEYPSSVARSKPNTIIRSNSDHGKRLQSMVVSKKTDPLTSILLNSKLSQSERRELYRIQLKKEQRKVLGLIVAVMLAAGVFGYFLFESIVAPLLT